MEFFPVLFKKGTHIVLLHSCKRGSPNYWSDTAPINHVYLLREDCSSVEFSVEVCLGGGTAKWYYSNLEKIVSNYNLSLLVRKASQEEILMYEENNFPVLCPTKLFL